MRWTRHLIGLLVLLALLATAASMIVMPGASHRGPLPALSTTERAAAARLRADVVALADEVGERRIGLGMSLSRATAYLLRRLQPLEVRGVRPRLEDVGEQGRHAQNIVIDLPAASRGNLVLVGAHYDSALHTAGANDNASGVAVLLELLQRFAGRRLQQPLRFVLFANEEAPFFQTHGMGSFTHAAAARARGETIAAMFSLETLGYYTDRAGSQEYPWPLSLAYPDTGNFVAFVGNRASASLVRRVVGVFRATTAFPSEGAALPAGVPGVGWSDQWSFWEHDYPGVMVTDTAPFRDPNYHRASDTPSHIDFERLARVTSGLETVLRAFVDGDNNARR
jgi:Zn-dependent M28 family amino/carboxypeptidase